MDNIPSPLADMLKELDPLDRVERAQYLLELSDEFDEVPEYDRDAAISREPPRSQSANPKPSFGLKTETTVL